MKGYIVVQDDHMLELDNGRANGHPYDGTILLWGDTGSVFPTYDSARNAIRRTTRYAARVGYNWQMDLCLIRQVRFV